MKPRLSRSPRPDWTARQAAIALCLIAAVGCALRVAATLREPMGYNAFSDDNSYINSAITFLKTGYVTYARPDTQSAVLGPGMPLLLGLLFAVFGYQRAGLLAAHIAFSFIGLVTAYGAYLLGKLLHSRRAGVLAAAFTALDMGMVFTNSAFYTETPYVCLTLYSLYFFISCVREWSWPRYLTAVLCFCVAAAFKGLALLTPVCVLPLLWVYRVPLRRWLPKAALLAGIFALVFLPWCVRNLMAFGSFTPFPTSQGDQKLMGTYVGIGCPPGAYDTDLKALHEEAWAQGYQEDTLRRLARRGELADARIAQWLQDSPLGFIATHLLYKPLLQLTMVFYPRQMLGVPILAARVFWWLCLALAALGLLLTLRSHKPKGFYLPLIYLTVALFVTSIYVPLDRYNAPHIPYGMLYAAIGLAELYERLWTRRRKPAPGEPKA